jgi:hypothetical protein
MLHQKMVSEKYFVNIFEYNKVDVIDDIIEAVKK